MKFILQTLIKNFILNNDKKYTLIWIGNHPFLKDDKNYILDNDKNHTLNLNKNYNLYDKSHILDIDKKTYSRY